MRINCCTLTQWKILGCHETGSAFELREEVIGPPETNLGGTIQGVELDDETKCLVSKDMDLLRMCSDLREER